MSNKIVISVEESDEDDSTFPIGEYIVGNIRLNCGRGVCFIITGCVNDLSPEQFLDELGTVLNDALLISNDLDLEISIDESVEDLAEELDEGLSDKMYQVYSEFIRKEVL
jgi:hypothetical protein